MIILGARNLFLGPKAASFHIATDEDSGERSNYIILEGWAEQASFYPDKKFWCQVTEVSDSFQYETVTLEETSIQKERQVLEYGYARLENVFDEQGEETDEELLEIYVQLQSIDFGELKYMVETSLFNNKATLTVMLSIHGMKLGHELGLDEFPKGDYLPILGFHFILGTRRDSEDED